MEAVPTTRLGVLGWPVAHSLSPMMHNAALAAVGLTGWRYQLLPVPPALFAATARALEPAGFAGANVTIPHKRAALELADEASPEAVAIGAANTLLFDRGSIRAENTDAPALTAALPFSPADQTALVIGAGGSARAAVWALLNAGARTVSVWNRTPERARELCTELGAVHAAEATPADFLVNCTPAGGSDDDTGLKSARLGADEIAMFRCVVDFAYGKGQTPLVSAARQAGVPVVDGLDLLIGQGALSFARLTGIDAPTGVMREALRAG